MKKIQYIKDLIYYNRKYLIAILVIIILIPIYFINSNTNSNNEILVEEQEQEIIDVKEQNEVQEKIVVDVKGEVNNPGTYEIDNNTRVNEVIEEAGGLTNEADTTNINLSKKVTDEMLIYIPKENEETLPQITESIISTPSTTQSDTKISINTASIDQLMTIKGIGQTKAQAIIDYRNANGSFKSIEELINVKGIGQTTVDKIKEYIKL